MESTTTITASYTGDIKPVAPSLFRVEFCTKDHRQGDVCCYPSNEVYVRAYNWGDAARKAASYHPDHLNLKVCSIVEVSRYID